MVFQTNGHHKTRNGWYLGLVALISSIIGLLILYTVFTWLNATPRIIATLDWYHNQFRNYGCKHRLRALSNGRF